MPYVSGRHTPKLLAVLAGVVYALAFRFVFNTGPFERFGGLLMLSFLIAVPFGLGILTAHYTPASRGNAWRYVFAPWIATTLFLLTAFVAHLEGVICLIIILPLFYFVSWLGARLYAWLEKHRNNKPDDYALVSAVALLPFVVAFAESRFTTPDSLRRVQNVVEIAAPPAVVWRHIVRVAPISPADLGPSLVDDIGFPRPVQATLTHEGIGGVRHATFERGVEFIETVDEWIPEQKLSFGIKPNTATIPPITFDEHVIVGGRFFDVLRGTYELQPLPNGHTRLVLFSQQRLSTNLNPYAGLWTDYVMSEIQRRILLVVKRRCEASEKGCCPTVSEN
ncbi:hypothetical protein D3Y59_10615 [Hymenobacter oligotrophus]|uniref:SRPBCC family protein n=1 Tax=Hymenobacter oligotrophus TaxID=2319843 RepID=A0A3B7QWG6_9BACT|nr:hypothetical protein [Hymenobacter oligotrophus]AYA37458.1 hypothetical protein D3Y59_10615 [Hymenobacter oligotrophus]